MPGRSPSVISFVLMSKTPTYSVVLTGRSIPPRRATVNLDGTDSPRLRRNHRQTDKRELTRTGESGLRAARTAFPGARGGTRKFLGTPSRNHEVLQDAPMSCGSCRSCPGTRQDERSCVPPVKSTQSRPIRPMSPSGDSLPSVRGRSGHAKHLILSLCLCSVLRIFTFHQNLPSRRGPALAIVSRF